MPMKPWVLVPCDVKRLGLHPYHCVGEKYLNAVAHGSDTWPLFVPGFGVGEDLDSLENHYEVDALLDRFHGVFLPGSASNVHPSRYGAADAQAVDSDTQRDSVVFTLLEAAIERRMPIFAVCRGFQELNVALGGTLHRAVQNVPGYDDHREDSTLPRGEQYLAVHEVHVEAGGLLNQIIEERRFGVNSLHGQGVDMLAPTLRVEARAPDGLIEAVSLPGQFTLGVQWHPEWDHANDRQSAALFRAFGQAVADYGTRA